MSAIKFSVINKQNTTSFVECLDSIVKLESMNDILYFSLKNGSVICLWFMDPRDCFHAYRHFNELLIYHDEEFALSSIMVDIFSSMRHLNCTQNIFAKFLVDSADDFVHELETQLNVPKRFD